MTTIPLLHDTDLVRTHVGEVLWIARNLNRATTNGGAVWTVRTSSNSPVIAHVTGATLGDVEFRVWEGTRQDALRRGHRNVHAFAIGQLLEPLTAPPGALPLTYDLNGGTFRIGGAKSSHATLALFGPHGAHAFR